MIYKCHYKNCQEEDDQYAKTGASVDGRYYCQTHYNLILNKAEETVIAEVIK